MFVGKGKHTISQIAPGGNKLVVVAMKEIRPRVITVTRLRDCSCYIVTDCIRIIALQYIMEPHSPVSTFTKCFPLDVHKLVCRHVKRQIQVLVLIFFINSIHAEQFSLPYHCVKWDVVLPDKIKNFRFRVVPPIFPCFWLSDFVGPFHRSCEISHNRFKPHIEPFGLPTLNGDRNPPLDVTRYGSPF